MNVLLAQRLSKSNGGARRRSPCRHFDHGVRLAALRAITGAKLYVQGGVPTIKAAATATGSCPPYVQAAITLLQSDNVTLTNEVLTGHVGLLEAARQVKHVARLVMAYRKASSADRVAFARAIGPTVLFDDTLVPAI